MLFSNIWHGHGTPQSLCVLRPPTLSSSLFPAAAPHGCLCSFSKPCLAMVFPNFSRPPGFCNLFGTCSPAPPEPSSSENVLFFSHQPHTQRPWVRNTSQFTSASLKFGCAENCVKGIPAREQRKQSTWRERMCGA